MGDADRSLKRIFEDIIEGDGTISPELDKKIVDQTPFMSKVKKELMDKGKGKIVGGFGYPSEPFEY